MELNEIKAGLTEARNLLSDFLEDDRNLELIKAAGDMLAASVKSGGKILTCGNGGSMSDAMHFAEELTGRFRDDRPAIPAIAIADPTHLTCTANDYGFDQIFARYVAGLGSKNDALFAISTSGNSINVIKAAETAARKGMKVVALTGKNGGKLAAIADVEIRIMHQGYSDRIQEMHIKIIHLLIQYIEAEIK